MQDTNPARAAGQGLPGPSDADEPDEPAQLPAQQERGGAAARGRQAAEVLTIAAPPVVWLVMGYWHRWIADDGMIEVRVVRQILAGHGPVFNVGERAEANTSVLWTWLLAAITGVTRINVYHVVVGTGLVLSSAGLLLALLGARTLHRRVTPGLPFLPLGALIVVALPPFWDFATSGLETPLIFFWLGLCWWLLTGVVDGGKRRVYATAFAAGLGWLVRPDMLLVTGCVLVALAVIRWQDVRRWLTATGLAVTALVLPVGYEIFRMGYYGLLVPNTALAKDATGSDIHQGLVYLANYVGPYVLWAPVAVVLLLVPAVLPWRRLGRADRASVLAVVAAALLMAGYVIRVGGDFMHARMLLPPTFALLLPVMGVPFPALSRRAVRLATAGGLTAVAVWTVVCFADLRLAQAPGVIPSTGITNEQLFWVERTRDAHPSSPTPYIRMVTGGATGDPSAAVSVILGGGAPSAAHPVLVYPGPAKPYTTPLNRRAVSVAAMGSILGSLGAILPLNDIAIDPHGLSYPYGSHMQADPTGRIGHAKLIGAPWIVADYGTSARAPGVDPAQVAAARRALRCGDMALLGRATTAPLTWGQFWTNLAHSFTLTKFRVPNDPLQAERQLCGTR